MAKVIVYKHDPKIHGPFFGVSKGAVSWNMPSRKRKPPASNVSDEQTQPPLGVEPIVQMVQALMEEERKRSE